MFQELFGGRLRGPSVWSTNWPRVSGHESGSQAETSLSLDRITAYSSETISTAAATATTAAVAAAVQRNSPDVTVIRISSVELFISTYKKPVCYIVR